jgi:hypothetical protein
MTSCGPIIILSPFSHARYPLLENVFAHRMGDEQSASRATPQATA